MTAGTSRSGHRLHYPAAGSRDDLPAGAVDHATPYRPGAHAVCGGCARPIVFIEGYELRRDYWRATGGRNR